MTSRIDSVASLDGTPTVVHVSDVHGYLRDARSALRAVGDAQAYQPVVTSDDVGRLHWADNDYVLVFNGDLIDRGPSSEACIELVWRLQREAPAGRVRYHVGNHEMALLLPTLVSWPDAYAPHVDARTRTDFLERIVDGTVSAVLGGYEYTYSHAGSNEPLDVQATNDALETAAGELLGAAGSDDDAVQRRVADAYDRLFAVGGEGGRGPGAGILWLDFVHLDASAPPQIVGHSMRERAVRDGNVVCGNVIRMNEGTAGGEGVLLETPDGLTALQRDRDGDVRTRTV